MARPRDPRYKSRIDPELVLHVGNFGINVQIVQTQSGVTPSPTAKVLWRADRSFSNWSTCLPVTVENSRPVPPLFLHLDKHFVDFNEIRCEIKQETYRVAGQNKGISKLPIHHLKICSPNVLDLTLVDLPGLTKVCLSSRICRRRRRRRLPLWCKLTFIFIVKIPVGDQPSDIETQIRSLVESSSSISQNPTGARLPIPLSAHPESLTHPCALRHSHSNNDVILAISASLKLTRSIDPQGLWTIGILTKLDLINAGTHALDVLTRRRLRVRRVCPLKLGFIGVVNRSQRDIDADKSMSDALESGAEFVRSHLQYRN
jgi:dynamin 1-like protein